MAERSRVAVLISGRGSNMAALIYASRRPDCPYEIALVSTDKRPDITDLFDDVNPRISGICDNELISPHCDPERRIEFC